MFDSLFDHFGVVWTAATVGTLLIPVILLVGWQTAQSALSTPRGQKLQRALIRAFPHHTHQASKPLPALAGRSNRPACPPQRRSRR